MLPLTLAPLHVCLGRSAGGDWEMVLWVPGGRSWVAR